jgi:hypothetical protein
MPRVKQRPLRKTKKLINLSLMVKSSANLLNKLLRSLMYPPLLESVFLKSSLSLNSIPRQVTLLIPNQKLMKTTLRKLNLRTRPSQWPSTLMDSRSGSSISLLRELSVTTWLQN